MSLSCSYTCLWASATTHQPRPSRSWPEGHPLFCSGENTKTKTKPNNNRAWCKIKCQPCLGSIRAAVVSLPALRSGWAEPAVSWSPWVVLRQLSACTGMSWDSQHGTAWPGSSCVQAELSQLWAQARELGAVWMHPHICAARASSCLGQCKGLSLAKTACYICEH